LEQNSIRNVGKNRTMLTSKTFKILLVEDNQDHANVIARHLTTSDYHPITKVNLIHEDRFSNALTRLEKENFDTVLLDLNLPDSSLNQTIDQLLQLSVHVPVIVLTSLGDEKLALSALKHGAQDFLRKDQISKDTIWRSIFYSIERQHSEDLYRNEDRRNKDLFDISQLTFTEKNLTKLFTKTAKKLTTVLNVDFVGVYEHNSKSNTLLLKAGVGLSEMVSNFKKIPLAPSSLHSKNSVFDENFNEKLFLHHEIWKKNKIESGLCSIIHGTQFPYGILSIHTKSQRTFQPKEEKFLKTIAALLAAAFERCKLESTLKETILELKETDSKKDEFLAYLAHELRNPLSPILSSVELLKLKENYPSVRSEKFIKIIEKQSKQLTRIVNDLLEVSHIIHGKINIQLQKLKLQDIIDCAIEETKDIYTKKRHTLKCKVSKKTTLPGDSIRLVQVFVNLLRNTANFTPDWGKIEIQSEINDSDLFVTVSDTGQGIPSKMVNTIFEPFIQEKPSREGLGIGLALCKKIVELHDGTIFATSKGIGKGSKFTVQLPLDPASNGKIKNEMSKKTKSKIKKQSIKGLNLLIIDDNKDYAQLTKLALERYGHRVSLAYCGEEGIEIATKNQFNFVFIDLTMPGLTGYDVVADLKKKLDSKFLIALTSFSDQQTKSKALDSGFTHFLTKTGDINEIEKFIKAECKKSLH